MNRAPLRSLTALSLLCALAVAGLAGHDAAAALDFEACRLERAGLPAAFGQCAELQVPEDPLDPASPTLGLFVARVPALTATPDPVPLLLINGGPGGSAVDLFLQARNAFLPTLRDRDIVLLDQRGTGRSLAGLSCDTPQDLALETATPDELRLAVEACIAEFPRDPALFTTSIAVRDIEALRAALGVARLNLYGVSYGTRVAQHYVRRFPDSVHAVVLDGVVPAGLTLGPDIAGDAQAALDAIFARCAADRACSDTFGDIAGKFAVLLDRFDGDSIEIMIQDPASGAQKLFDLAGVHLQSVVRLMSYADTTAALLPVVLDAAFQGDLEPLAAQADLLIESVADSLGFAMHNSVVCTEDVPFFPAAAPATGGVGAQPYLGTSIVDGLKTICEVWPRGLLDEDFREPLTTDKPVLLLSGENDPVTPPAYAEAVAQGLPNARHLIGSGKGHGIAALGCLPRLLRLFYANADAAALDTSCLDIEGPQPFFLSFQGPGP